MLARVVAAALRAAALAALAYAVYRLIAGERRRVEPLTAPPAPPEPAAPPARRNRAGTAPADTRPPPGGPAGSAGGEAPGPPRVRSIGVGEVPEHVPRWVEPDDAGACPASHPLKAKLESGIYHPPDGRHYDRTRADRCYRDSDAAEADGLRRSKQ